MKLLSKQDSVFCSDQKFSFDLTVLVDDEQNSARFNFKNLNPNNWFELPPAGLDIFAGLDGEVRPFDLPTHNEMSSMFVKCLKEFVRKFDLQFWYH
jgi:hypothetical protein